MRQDPLLTELRKNARASVPMIAQKHGLSTSTAYDRIRRMEPIITRYTALIDFRKLGYSSHSYFVARTAPERRDSLSNMLATHPNINNLFWISCQDLLGEVLFTSPLDEDLFYSMLSRDNMADVTRFPVIGQLNREKLLTGDEVS